MGAGGKALNWGAGALSQVGTQDDTMHTMTRWDWSDCGESSDRAAREHEAKQRTPTETSDLYCDALLQESPRM